MVQVQQRTPMGVFASSRPCQRCRGTGKIIHQPCADCGGSGAVRKRKTIKVTIPAGIDHGQTISLRGQGNAGKNGGPAGDLLITVRAGSYTHLLLSLSNNAFSSCVTGQVTEAFILGTLCWLGMLILRLPYALPVSVIIAALSLIPIFGAWIGAATGAFLIVFQSPITVSYTHLGG